MSTYTPEKIEISILKIRLKMQEQLLAKQEKSIEAIRMQVYQILGGIYNQNSQKSVLQYNIDMLYGKEPTEKIAFHEDKWPTTRQGDDHESRIDALEQFVEMTAQAASKTIPKRMDSRMFTREFCGND
jgi:hypothetical protein